VLAAVTKTLLRRGFLTSEWWTTIAAAGLSTVLALVGVHGSAAAQVVGILAPVIVAATYAAVRTMHKSTLAKVLAAAFPLPANTQDSSSTG
jgi:hypothetical protein